MKICCVFNYNPLYRFPIYDAMSKEFDCNFFFGDSVFKPLKSFDTNKLKGFKGTIKAKKILRNYFVYHSQTKRIFDKKYTHYVATGDISLIITWMILIYSKIKGKKVYLWTHGVNTDKLKLATKILSKLMYRSATGILLYNNYNIKFMEKLGCNKERLHVIHNSLDTNIQTSIYHKLKPSNVYFNHFNNNYPTVIYIGRIQKRMKVELLIEALSILKGKGHIINAVIVGAYVDGVNIEELVREKGLTKQVWMYGPSFDEEVNSELLYNADVCVAPGTVGLTAIHALSYGTPCITHSNHSATGPEFEAIKEGVTGSFFEENNIHSLVEAISKWINVKTDRRNKTREAAREEVEKYWSVESQIDVLKTLFNK